MKYNDPHVEYFILIYFKRGRENGVRLFIYLETVVYEAASDRPKPHTDGRLVQRQSRDARLLFEIHFIERH